MINADPKNYTVEIRLSETPTNQVGSYLEGRFFSHGNPPGKHDSL
jgi:hypothetical protein